MEQVEDMRKETEGWVHFQISFISFLESFFSVENHLCKICEYISKMKTKTFRQKSPFQDPFEEYVVKRLTVVKNYIQRNKAKLCRGVALRVIKDTFDFS